MVRYEKAKYRFSNLPGEAKSSSRHGHGGVDFAFANGGVATVPGAK
jgi:hypothetical protein